MKIVFNGRCKLYDKSVNWNRIQVFINSNGEIYTYWSKSSKDKYKIDHGKRRAIIQDLKLNGCSRCGYNKSISALDFHHVIPDEKKFNITAKNVYHKDFVREYHKCILLCKNCHSEVHDI